MFLTRVILEVTSGPYTGRTYTFDSQDSLLIGRADDAQLRIEGDQHISRNHCLIEVSPPRCHVVDLNSVNGTFVNEERISERWLRHGDTIRGGQTQISVHIDQADDVANQPTLVGGIAMDGTIVPTSLTEQIGSYRVVGEVGRGTMGVVYKAQHTLSGEVVALKVLSPETKITKALQQSFIREAGILCGLTHRRIVSFIEAGSSDDQLFIAMQFVEAVDLVQTLNSISEKQRVRVSCGLIRQILEGLGYAHLRGLVHRDIKPRNLLVALEDKRLSARLADFGLAKNFADAGLSQISSEHELKGTLCFMAPEQIVSSRNAKPAADIFSAGATLYTLITGKQIYDLSNHQTPLADILNAGPVPLIKRSPQIPKSICDIVDKALSYNADDRFHSAAEMWTELARAMQQL